MKPFVLKIVNTFGKVLTNVLMKIGIIQVALKLVKILTYHTEKVVINDSNQDLKEGKSSNEQSLPDFDRDKVVSALRNGLSFGENLGERKENLVVKKAGDLVALGASDTLADETSDVDGCGFHQQILSVDGSTSSRTTAFSVSDDLEVSSSTTSSAEEAIHAVTTSRAAASTSVDTTANSLSTSGCFGGSNSSIFLTGLPEESTEES